ncbi:hypothetical protein SAMN05216482_0186 [Streptomyces sp. PAN_FS17]|nr:hypothetical protein SAMN05216482_0186 [Streptomyces sp. PAN_FS17]
MNRKNIAGRSKTSRDEPVNALSQIGGRKNGD